MVNDGDKRFKNAIKVVSGNIKIDNMDDSILYLGFMKKSKYYTFFHKYNYCAFKKDNGLLEGDKIVLLRKYKNNIIIILDDLETIYELIFGVDFDIYRLDKESGEYKKLIYIEHVQLEIQDSLDDNGDYLLKSYNDVFYSVPSNEIDLIPNIKIPVSGWVDAESTSYTDVIQLQKCLLNNISSINLLNEPISFVKIEKSNEEWKFYLAKLENSITIDKYSFDEIIVESDFLLFKDVELKDIEIDSIKSFYDNNEEKYKLYTKKISIDNLVKKDVKEYKYIEKIKTTKKIFSFLTSILVAALITLVISYNFDLPDYIICIVFFTLSFVTVKVKYDLLTEKFDFDKITINDEVLRKAKIKYYNFVIFPLIILLLISFFKISSGNFYNPKTEVFDDYKILYEVFNDKENQLIYYKVDYEFNAVVDNKFVTSKVTLKRDKYLLDTFDKNALNAFYNVSLIELANNSNGDNFHKILSTYLLESPIKKFIKSVYKTKGLNKNKL